MSYKLNVEISSTGCWVYKGKARTHNGYALRKHEGKLRPYHRVVFEMYKGAIPQGLVLDHLCKVRDCVNPDHLEPVTQQQNVARGDTGKASAYRASLITRCVRGHEFNEVNTRTDGRGRRFCRPCGVIRTQKWANTKAIAKTLA